VTKKSICYQPYELTRETWKKKILEKTETSLYVTKEIKRKNKRREEKKQEKGRESRELGKSRETEREKFVLRTGEKGKEW